MDFAHESLPAGLTAETDSDADVQREFWLTHMRIGFGVFLAETVVVLIYLGLTPRLPHRAVLWILIGSWFILAVAGLRVAPFVATKPWRSAYSVAWTVLSAFAVGSAAMLDLGPDSPMLLLLFLPLIYAALMFTPAESGLCGLAALTVAVVVTEADPSTSASLARSLMLFAVLGGASVLSIAASVNRTRIENHEQRLLTTVAEIAATDELTGCATRRIFRQRLEEEIARSTRHGRPLSLMMIDVDEFKRTNDTYGHAVGDQVLAALGTILRRSVRSFDVVGRLGGDEFAVLLPDTDATSAVALADRIRHDLCSGTEVPVTISIGVSGRDGATTASSEQLFDEADLALYEVKRGGRDAISVRHVTTSPH